MTLDGFLKATLVIGGAVALGYAASSCAELSEEGRFWHKRLKPGPDDDEEDDGFEQDENDD